MSYVSVVRRVDSNELLQPILVIDAREIKRLSPQQ